MSFTHLHVHSQYSILDGASPISQIIKKAKDDGMPAVALTDHGVMFGVKEFYNQCKREGMKPILGFEGYMVDSLADDKDRSNHHLVLLAKNEKGYRNLLKLTSIANIDGVYYRPRFDQKVLKECAEGLIITSACLGGEIPHWIMLGELEKAEERILWFKEIFGDDYYLELQRHPNNNPWDNVWANQQLVNKHLIEFSKKLGVKLVATNDSHFINKEDAEAHDLLICMSTGKDFDDPNRMRYTRQEWFKTTAEMQELFADLPEAISNTVEIANKVEEYELNSAPIMPEFPIPESFATWEDYQTKFDLTELIQEFKFSDADTDEHTLSRLGGVDKMLRIKYEADYLSYLTYNGSVERYGEQLNEVQAERIKFELDTIKKMGFPGYFLIVQDFIAEARNMGVLVGPGRGSAAGAVVAYCLKITNIDPIKYDLLFERFLNPDRISMPDIDIDFDDDGRQLVLEWVMNKYGHEKVAHICTFGTMAAKSSIKDVARVLKLPLSETNAMTKEFPENGKLKSAYQLLKERELEGQKLVDAAQYWKNHLKGEGVNKKAFPPVEVLDFFVEELGKARAVQDRVKESTLRFACSLEGSVRQTGIHACGILIGKDPLVEHIPLMPAKGEHMLNTQYDGHFVEEIGLLKMDFLGLKTLSIIKETLVNIKNSTGKDLDLDDLPLDDKKTFKLFCDGSTTAIFQFESPGMKKNLRSLMPNRFEDLVAMNALYRPGPMEYIPNYIARKLGKEKVAYDHPLMEKYLGETYGITVFQEQVMLLSRLLGNFTRGESDSLRKAMGKKQIDMMNKLKVKFIEGCLNNPEFMSGYDKEVDKKAYKKPEDLVEKIWKDWEAFASYAFNKSHSVCYADLAYRTAYLKAHYPAEFMAGILSCNLGNAEKIATFMDECRQMGMDVLGPDVNESLDMFTVNDKGQIRFGMAGIKGAGTGAVENIIKERREKGKYKDIFDFAERVNLSSVNKKTWESLAYSGGFDSLGDFKRSQYFTLDPANNMSFISKLINYGNQIKLDRQAMENSLFGDMMDNDNTIKLPQPTKGEDWTPLDRLKLEKDHIGIYLTDHPLNQFKYQIKSLCSHTLKDLADNISELEGVSLSIGAIITNVEQRITQKGKPFGKVNFEDHSGAYEHAFFGEDWVDRFNHKCIKDVSVILKGKVERRKWGDQAIEFKVYDIELLSTLAESRINSITIDIPVHAVTNDLVSLLGETLEGAKDMKEGKRLLVNIINEETGDKIRLRSGKIALRLENEFLDKLSAITVPKKIEEEVEEEEDSFFSVLDTPLHFSLN